MDGYFPFHICPHIEGQCRTSRNDASDAKNAVKSCIRELQLDDKIYKPGEVLSRISTAKNYLVTASDYMNNHEAIRKDTQMRKGRICDVYKLYAEKCKAEGVMDFDDILLYTNILLNKHPEVAESLRSVISHILVDEYQDTNMAQYRIVRILAARSHNITVVGDDSQSIYAFRGARIQNILNFKRDYPEAREFRLEQNSHSAQCEPSEKRVLLRGGQGREDRAYTRLR